MTPFLTAYLARIGWEQTPDVSLETLRALHLHHNGAIPFENLDVVLPREIELSDEAIFHKLVVARRGGYCFEQNGLFERVLKEVGFTVRSLLGRVVIANPHQMPPRTHAPYFAGADCGRAVDRRCRIWRADTDRANPLTGGY